MIFHEPMTALDPVYTIRDQIAETVMRHPRPQRRRADCRQGHRHVCRSYRGIWQRTRRVDAPEHPYTRAMLASTVQGQMRDVEIETIPGSPPDLGRLPPGCSFAPRCRYAAAECSAAVPAPRAVSARPVRLLHQGGRAPNAAQVRRCRARYGAPSDCLTGEHVALEEHDVFAP